MYISLAHHVLYHKFIQFLFGKKDLQIHCKSHNQDGGGDRAAKINTRGHKAWLSDQHHG